MINDVFCYLVLCSYRDPKTGLPYATKEAFKTIRERYELFFSNVNLFAIRSIKCPIFILFLFYYYHQATYFELSRSASRERTHVILCNCVGLCRFAQETAGNKKDSTTELLSNPNYEAGFSHKRKRSAVPNDSETSYYRHFARFRRIPALEMQDSD